jgi:hypothetical protein
MAKKKQNPPQSKSYTKSGDIQAGKAKPVGKRYTDKLAKKLGKSPNAEPTQKDINKYLGKGVYDEKRKDKSDISLRKKFEMGGDMMEMGGDMMANGGGVKQNPPQSKSYTKRNDIQAGKAKPVGKRYTDKLAKKLGKSPNADPTQKDINKYLGKGVYDEKRKDKSDISLSKKFEDGGATVEISVEEMKSTLGREPRYPSDFINGKKYVKCFLRPYYRLAD